MCREALRLVGKNDHLRITLDSIALAEWMPSFDAEDYEGVARIILDSTQAMTAAGAEFAICPDNSAHLAWDYVQAETPIPWLHIGHVVGDEARQRGYRRIGVLGTRLTMAGRLYRDTLAAAGIEAIPPERDDFEIVDRIIFEELVDGVVTDASRQQYRDVIAPLGERGCDAVALACTEIPMLVGPDDSPLPTLDSTRLLAEAALRKVIA
jgi:aspartate racemase